MPKRSIKKVRFTLMVPVIVSYYPDDFESKQDFPNFVKRMTSPSPKARQKNCNNAFYDNVSRRDVIDAFETASGEVTMDLEY